ncbi:hypothetical protein AA15669_1650 [Saccharibacter floricola DSM 15669]|uniref:Uncharacterized protein n=1 Tax=Saccharibacter floricola DSM 15669 TaxID=1123227 RepID=A0ABQ0P3R1_9PROT|nr:hypothetical protein [Saccharibacter floricola]GBQ08095.1 hypothetical protein AA15669_1650 [Saccharibacter floricola DSM 15669]
MSDTDNRSEMPQTIQHYYYAQTTKQPDGAYMVTGWFDVTDQTDPATYPAPDTLVPITAEEFERQFSQRVRTDWQIVDGKIAPYTQKRPALPLKEQAQNALGAVQKQAAMVIAMGEEFGPKTRAYVQALRAIADGSDTTSTQLPTAPDDVTT